MTLALALPAYGQDGDIYAVSEEHLACLLEHKASYIAFGPDPLIIVAPACPEVDPAIALGMLSTNSDMPKISTRNDNVQDIIVYTSAQLSCLTLEQIVVKDGKALLPAQPQCK